MKKKLIEKCDFFIFVSTHRQKQKQSRTEKIPSYVNGGNIEAA